MIFEFIFIINSVIYSLLIIKSQLKNLQLKSHSKSICNTKKIIIDLNRALITSTGNLDLKSILSHFSTKSRVWVTFNRKSSLSLFSIENWFEWFFNWNSLWFTFQLKFILSDSSIGKRFWSTSQLKIDFEWFFSWNMILSDFWTKISFWVIFQLENDFEWLLN